MIVSEKIKVKITKRNVEHFKKFYPSIKLLDVLTIKSEELNHTSHKNILIKCDICGIEKRTVFKNYFNYLKRSSDGKYTCCKCNGEKRKETCLKIYGVNYVANSDIVKEKKRTTCSTKYGVEYYFQSDEFKTMARNIFIKRGFNVCSLDKNEWSRYQRICITESYKNYDILKNKWNGYDYYDGEYIMNNYNLDPNDSNYPTVDHKISIIYGYLNNMPTEKISSIENLCITKRNINSKKRHLIENNFIYHK